MSAQIVFDDGVSPTTGSIERGNAFLGTAFTASNFDNTGILGWQWTILYKPPGSATGLTSSTSATPQFTPDVEGTYLLRLQVFADAARTQLVDSDEQFVSVAFAAPYAWHIPAVGETGQRGAAGWGNPVETILRSIRAAIVSVVSGITQLTGDATAGPGSGSQSVTVVQARGLRETGGPTTLTLGAVADGEYLLRSGTTLIGGPGGGGGGGSTTIREILIENGVTLVAGDVVRPQSASHVGKASANVNGLPALGIVLVGGVGDGTTVYALVAMEGYVSGLSGLTTGATVYLGTTAGQYTTTMPTAAGARVVALGQAISTTEMILNVDIPRPPSLIALAVNAEQTGTSELSVGMVYLSSGAVVAADSRAMLGATSGVSDTADLRLRRFTGGTQVAIFSATGTPANTAITASYTVAASDWYELTLAAGGAAQVARCQGVQLRVYGETN